MNHQDQDLEAIKEVFAKSLLEAISSKSVEAHTKLVMSYEDYKKLGSIRLDISKEAYQAAVLTQSEQFFEKKSRFIDERNAHVDSAINLDNLAMVINTSLPMSNDYEILQHMGFIKPFRWDDINEENTPYPLVEDNKQLHKIVEKYAKKEYIEVIDYFSSWYVHEGDLILEKYDIKVNLIVTGNLTIREPVAEIRNELIVLGNTKVNVLYLLEEGNNTLFLGGVEFKVAIFVIYSGAYQVLNNPRGPLIYAGSETVFIDTTEQVQCTYAPDQGFEDDCSEILLPKFLIKYEDGFSEINIEAVVEAIRTGENIFKA